MGKLKSPLLLDATQIGIRVLLVRKGVHAHAPYASLWRGQLYQDLLRPLELFVQLRTYKC